MQITVSRVFCFNHPASSIHAVVQVFLFYTDCTFRNKRRFSVYCFIINKDIYYLC